MYFPIATGHAYTPKWRIPGSSAGFGYLRAPGREHAGCDLGAAHGTPVVAIEGGVVVERGIKPFIKNTNLWAIAIKHDSGFVARYTEINGIPETLRKGHRVTGGQQLGFVQQGGKLHMLHFEVYQDPMREGSLSIPPYLLGGKSASSLTDGDCQRIKANGYFAKLQRRDDILDPREFLLALEAQSVSGVMAALKEGVPGVPSTIKNQPRTYDGPLSVEVGAMNPANFGASDTQMAVNY